MCVCVIIILPVISVDKLLVSHLLLAFHCTLLLLLQILQYTIDDDRQHQPIAILCTYVYIFAIVEPMEANIPAGREPLAMLLRVLHQTFQWLVCCIKANVERILKSCYTLFFL